LFPDTMIRFPIVRNRLLAFHLLGAALLAALAGISAWRLFAFPPDPLSAAGLVGLVAGLGMLPPILFRTVFLFTAGYEIHPSGGLIIRYGSRREIVPIEEIEEIRSGSRIPDGVRSASPGWLEMWRGRVEAADEGPVEWLATDRGQRLLLLISKRRRWAVSPSNPTGFARRLTEMSAHGGLEKIQPVSETAPPVLVEIITNPAAAVLLGAGLAGMTALGAFLTGIQPGLPADQPFRFDPSGTPTSLGDPVRLLILPVAGGAVWLVNAFLGWWAWRKGRQPAAYALWVVSLLVTIGLWAAGVELLSAR
jgi:hypothetical protein